jgi:nitroreductase
MSKELLLLLRERVATRYYDRPEVVDELARILYAARIVPPG